MIKQHVTSIGHAMNGVRWAFRTQPNYRVHLIASSFALGFGYMYDISYVEWLVILVMIIGGFTVETFNTAIERLGDAIDMEYNEHIKLAKDLGAGAMLFYSIGALIIAAIIFLPKILFLALP